jgi:AcrR family transcriptional regulator
MARPNQSPERRKELIPEIARTFAQLGYRRTTTAELARRCGVQETILYRLWPSKKEMFIACIDYVYELSSSIWEDLLGSGHAKTSAAEFLLDYEASHHGEFGFYRIVFAGLSETDDPDVHDALRRMYKRFQRFVRDQIKAHRTGRSRPGELDAAIAAWAFVGLGTVSNIGRELDLFSSGQRSRLMKNVGHMLLEGG